MAEKPIVSVIISTYNHKKYISQAIESVLIQKTTFPFEIIIGEDESNDGTREICIEYAQKYPDKIRLFLRSRKDVIYVNKRATGRHNFIENLKKATGKYVALCSGDDYWTDPLKLQKQIDFLNGNNKFSWSIHNAEILDDKTGLRRDFYASGFKFNVIDTNRVISLSGGFFHTASLVFRRDSIAELPNVFYKVRAGDWALILLISLHGKGKFLPDTMSVYRIHQGGIFSGLKDNQLERITALKSDLYLLAEFNKFTKGVYWLSVLIRRLSLRKKIIQRYIKYMLSL
jgi:glycosyltransferase involved in cell wall biosynthesis